MNEVLRCGCDSTIHLDLLAKNECGRYGRWRMADRFIVRTPPRLVTAPPFGYALLLRVINEDGSFGRTVEVQITDLEFVKAGIDPSAMLSGTWSALLLALRDRIDLQILLDDDPSISSCISVVSSELTAAAQTAGGDDELPDLTIENARF